MTRRYPQMGALTPFRPFRELERLSRNLEARFPRLLGDWPFEADGEAQPALESYVKDGTLYVRTDMPGIDAKDVDVSVLGNVLTIKGERKESKEVKENEYIRREVSYGAFERRMTLPEGAVTDKVKAQVKNGVVEITMPVGEKLSARKIPVEAAQEKEKK
jgi:HSP20 family protein